MWKRLLSEMGGSEMPGTESLGGVKSSLAAAARNCGNVGVYLSDARPAIVSLGSQGSEALRGVEKLLDG